MATIKTNNVNDLIFPVEKVENTEYKCNSEYSFDVFGYPNNANGIPEKTKLNCCSDRYNLTPNSEIFLPIRETLADQGIKFEENYKIINNARFYGDYTIKDHKFSLGGNDDIFLKLHFGHSYNGLTNYYGYMSFMRQICTNGLSVPVKELNEYSFSFSGKHTEKMKLNLSEMFNKVDYFINNGANIIKPFADMSGQWVENYGERIIEVLQANKITMVDNKNFNTLMSITETIEHEASVLYADHKKVNNWLIYNGINQYINNDERNTAVPEKRNELDRRVLDYMTM